MKFRFIRPQIFEDLPHIDCFFTEANREADPFGKSEKVIPGLNFGLNSQASEEEVEENYQTLFSYAGLNRQLLAIARQVHESEIRIVHQPGISDHSDGLITTEKELILGIQVADCTAVQAADSNPDHAVAGAFHAGWRGALKGIVPKGVNKMVQEGGNLETIKVYISPSISVENFEVGVEVASEFPAEFCDSVSYKKPHINLKEFIRSQLISCGIPERNIECSPFCTFGDDRFYSYRREGNKAGRMLGTIRLKEPGLNGQNFKMG